MAIRLQDKAGVDAPSGQYPFGKPRNNSGSGDGFPVDFNTHNDIHQFFAKLMSDAGIVHNGQPENATDGFQLNVALDVVWRKIIDINSGNLNNITQTGFYYCNTGTINRPSGVSNGYVLVIVLDSNYQSQRYIPFDADRYFIRRKVAGVWQAWVEIAMQSYVDSSVAAEATARANADATEASARSSQDTTLQNNINSEASTRASAVSAEATARANGDNALNDSLIAYSTTGIVFSNGASAGANLGCKITGRNTLKFIGIISIPGSGFTNNVVYLTLPVGKRPAIRQAIPCAIEEATGSPKRAIAFFETNGDVTLNTLDAIGAGAISVHLDGVQIDL